MKKTGRLELRTTEAEKRDWTERAKREGLESVSELIRKTMSRTAPRSKPQEPACHRSVSDSD